MSMFRSMHRHAFSLVELSIVLVILGLLTGGILGGQALIRAAELRSVSTDVAKYRTAMATFRDKYLQNPGDITNATQFWGAADGGDGIGSDCRGAETLDQRTCNGNGDGLIGAHPDLEYARLWQHLSNAGIIEGRYIGTGASYVTSCTVSSPGCLYPGSKLGGNSLWMISRVEPTYGYTYSYYDNKNALLLTSSVTSPILGGTLKPEDAYNIDMKMDDGKPGTGTIMNSRTGQCDTSPINSTSDAARQSANYALTNQSLTCVMHFMDVMP
ncbi:MAG: hypothetical protein DI582_06735 [Azospirillum brasilense]|nr:MAG: hypothetical protein DI582_06735 [Azospirillum brasilense]